MNRQTTSRKTYYQSFSLTTRSSARNEHNENRQDNNRCLHSLTSAASLLQQSSYLKKGGSSYAITEAKRFLYEVGKANAISQTDAEASIKAAAEELARQMNGLSVRAAHTGSKNCQGSIERDHHTLHAQVRTLRLSQATIYKVDALEVQTSHPIVTWLTRHTSWLRNHYLVHGDGLPSYQLTFNGTSNPPPVELADKAHYKLHCKHSIAK